jgi:hypothetical protein
MELRKVLVGLIVLSTIAFTVGAILERSSADTHALQTGAEEAGHQEGEVAHTEEGEGAGEPVADSAVSEGTEGDETLFGIDPESTPLVVLAVVLSLLLAAGCWWRPGWRWLLILTAVAMVVFAVLDVREVVHQLDESNTGLGLTALLVAVLHAAAAVTAGVLLSRTRTTEGERAPA